MTRLFGTILRMSIGVLASRGLGELLGDIFDALCSRGLVLDSSLAGWTAFVLFVFWTLGTSVAVLILFAEPPKPATLTSAP